MIQIPRCLTALLAAPKLPPRTEILERKVNAVVKSWTVRALKEKHSHESVFTCLGSSKSNLTDTLLPSVHLLICCLPSACQTQAYSCLLMEEERWSEAIMGALISLDISQFSHLTHTLALDSMRTQRRLCFLLSSPHHFTQTLQYIESLSFQQKALLLAHLLLCSLREITLSPAASLSDSHATKNLRMENSLHYDAGLLLLALCDSSDLDCVDWHASLTNHFLEKTLSLAGLGVSRWAVLGPCVDIAVNCRRFLEAVTGTTKVSQSVTCVKEYDGNGNGNECVICWELMDMKGDGCELPCGHVFHWPCVLPWLRKVNTCPCCRFELPTSAKGNDVFCEMERLWRLVVARSRRN